MKAGMMAPSAGNQQPWHFIVIRYKEKLLEISKRYPYAPIANGAQVGSIVCGDLSLATRHKYFWVQDCSVATQTILAIDRFKKERVHRDD